MMAILARILKQPDWREPGVITAYPCSRWYCFRRSPDWRAFERQGRYWCNKHCTPEIVRLGPGDVAVDAHRFQRRGWRFWICAHCYAPRSLHPRPGYRQARPLGDNRYLSANAPHFKEGW